MLGMENFLKSALGVSEDELKETFQELVNAEKTMQLALQYFRLRMDQVVTLAAGKPIEGTAPLPVPFETTPVWAQEILDRLERLEHAAGIGSPARLNGYGGNAPTILGPGSHEPDA